MAEAEETQQFLRISVYTPLIYVAVMATAFVAFSVFYRRHRLRKLIEVEPLFGRNYSLELYILLKDKFYNKLLPKEGRPPEKVVKAALLRRAVEAIRRSLKLKENEPVFNKLWGMSAVQQRVASHIFPCSSRNLLQWSLEKTPSCNGRSFQELVRVMELLCWPAGAKEIVSTQAYQVRNM